MDENVKYLKINKFQLIDFVNKLDWLELENYHDGSLLALEVKREDVEEIFEDLEGYIEEHDRCVVPAREGRVGLAYLITEIMPDDEYYDGIKVVFDESTSDVRDRLFWTYEG